MDDGGALGLAESFDAGLNDRQQLGQEVFRFDLRGLAGLAVLAGGKRRVAPCCLACILVRCSGSSPCSAESTSA